ncbi:MAG: peptidoglycan DD-metalloendopeptidase family protein [Oscillospiraceae bacterium]
MKKVKFNASAFSRFITGKGFYAVVGCCVAAVAVAGYMAYSRTNDLLNSADDSDVSIGEWVEQEPVAKTQSDVPKKDTDTEKEVSEDTQQEASEPANNPVKSKRPMVMPVNGEILNPFSNGELVKSKTLGSWKTHDGIDIAAAENAEVHSMTSGTVKEVLEDPLWGICVVIDHGDGLEGHYCNLTEAVTVKAGDEVMANDVIGAVGKTADIESAEESHIHFGLKRDGKWINPEDVFSKVE